MENWTIVALALELRVSRPTIYKLIDRTRKQEFAHRKSPKRHFLSSKFGMKRLAKVEASIEHKHRHQCFLDRFCLDSHNTNDLPQRFFPKEMKIGDVSKNKIDGAQFLINIRPRKALNNFSPIEFLSGKCVSYSR